MRLIEACSYNPVGLLSAYEHLERYVNNGSPSGENRSVSALYTPAEGVSKFHLPWLPIENSRLVFIGHKPSRVALQTVKCTNEDFAKFFIHPDMVDKNGVSTTKNGFAVFPTSSGRTVCHPDKEDSVYIKLHYDGVLGRISRKMTRTKVSESIYFSEELAMLVQQGVDYPKFDYFPESLGLVTEIEGQEMGFVVLVCLLKIFTS